MNVMQDARMKLRLRAFGVTEIGVMGPDGDAADLQTPLGMKARAMIAYLADAAPKPVGREALVELLWERVGAAQGKGSLRQEIRRIKRAFGDEAFAAIFTVTDHHIGVVEDALDYDAAEAQRAAASDDPDQLAELLSIHGGEFLSDNAARADAFQSWARARRMALNDQVIAGLARLGELDLAAGRIGRAQEAADRIISIDPLHETGHECRIRCHVASGRRAEARAHFERFRKLMLRELAEEPSVELAALVNPGAPKPVPRPAPAAEGGVGSRPVIAVLDVSPRSEGDQAYLAAGVAEELIANLSKSTWIKVASLNVATFLPGLESVDRAQRDLREYADYVLRLDIRVSGERAAILATLSRVADAETVFSDRVDDRIEDLLALQRRVALRIASIFEPMVLDDQAARVAAARHEEPQDFDHWRTLMKAHWLFWTTNAKNNAEAQVLLARALETRPNDVPALCLMGFAHMLEAWADWSGDVDGSVAEAQRWAERAVQAAPNDGWAQFTLGMTCSTPESLEHAKSRIAHARTLAPSLVIAVGEHARLHMFSGEPEPALALADEALARSPYDQQSGLWVRTKSFAHWLRGDLDQALELVDYALIVRPAWFQNHLLKASILAEMGDLERAAHAYAGARSRIGRYSLKALRLGHPFSDPAHFRRFVEGLNKAGAGYEI